MKYPILLKENIMLKEHDAKHLLEILKEADYSKNFRVLDSQLSLLFYQSKGVDSYQLEDSFYEDLLEKGILMQEKGMVYASVRVVFFEGNFFMVDSPHIASTGGISRYHSNKDGMYGFVGDDGLMLINYVIRGMKADRYQNGLDIGTGSGLIGISLLPWIDSIVGVDIMEPAITWAQLNKKINHVDRYFPRVGSLYEPVQENGPFDFIVSNPSFSFSPPDFIKKYKVQEHEISKDYGLEQVFKIIDGFSEHLTSNGRAVICTLAPIIYGEDYLINKIKEKYSNCRYSVKIHYNLIHKIPIEYEKYYRSCGIERLNFVFITIVNGQDFLIKKSYSNLYFLSLFRWRFKVPLKLKHWLMKYLS